MLFRPRAEPIGKAVAETAETGASPKRRTSVLPPPWCALIPLDALRRKRPQLKRTTGSAMVAAHDSKGAPKERHGPPDLDRRPATHHRRTACCDPRQDPGRARRAVDRLPEALPLRPGRHHGGRRHHRGLAQGRRAGLHQGRGCKDAAAPRACRQQSRLRAEQYPGDRQNRPDRPGAGDRRDTARVGHGRDLRRSRSGGLAQFARQACAAGDARAYRALLLPLRPLDRARQAVGPQGLAGAGSRVVRQDHRAPGWGGCRGGRPDRRQCRGCLHDAPVDQRLDVARAVTVGLTRRAFGGAVLVLGACSPWQPEPVRTLAPGTLRIGTYFVNPPFEYLSNGQRIGFEVDLMNEIARRLALTPVFVDTHWETILQQMQAGQYDVIVGGITITLERERTLAWSTPYMITTLSLVIDSRRSPQIGSVADFRNASVGVQAATTDYDIAIKMQQKGQIGSVKVYSFDRIQDAMVDLAAGRITAVMKVYPVAAWLARQTPHLSIVAQVPHEPQPLRIRLGQNNPGLWAPVKRPL